MILGLLLGFPFLNSLEAWSVVVGLNKSRFLKNNSWFWINSSEIGFGYVKKF